MKKEIIHTTKILITAFILSLGISTIYAWTAPTQAPPAGNTLAPVNVGATIQVKSGALGVAAFTANNASFTGKVGIGTTNPGSKLEVNGYITATVGNDICISGGNCLSSVGSGGTITSISEGTGIDLNPNTITTTGSVSLDTTYTDGRYINVGEAIDGDNITDGTIDSSEIQDGSLTSADINTGSIQTRVSGTCSAGSSIRSIAADGTVTCETDDVGVSGTISGETASMSLPSGTWTVVGWGKYFTCSDYASSFKLDGVTVASTPSHGNTSGCDHVTLMGRKTGVASGSHNWSLTFGNEKNFIWVAYIE
jgi:hypothetical protein